MLNTNENLTTFTDLYQLTMMYGYFKERKQDEEVVFDLFFRRNPFKNGYTIAAGLENLIDYIKNLSFSHEDIDYLKSTGLFPDEEFFKELRNFRFTGNIKAVEEGTVVFPSEPLVRVHTRLFEAQLIETALLSLVGHQTLLATKANRIVRSAEGKNVIEMGARRGQGPESSTLGARAAFIGGVGSTSNVSAGRKFGIPITGTHAHSWVMSFDSELEAFQKYGKHYPDNLILLVDTYDVINSGIPNAMKVFKEVSERLGRAPKKFGIRLDSGDLTYLSREARKILDAAGFKDAIIVASNDLDEYTIRELESQGALIDSYGVGTKLITAYDQPALGCVYKLAAEKINDEWVPRIKRSENVEKVTNPGMKKVVRFFDNETKHAIVDLIMLDEEEIPQQPFEVFDQVHTWKRKVVNNTNCVELLQPIFENGELVYKMPTIQEIVENVKHNLNTFSEYHTRFSNPHEYHVDLSQKLWDTKMDLLKKTDFKNKG
ncbi:gp277 [Bacillus phage G]|uniref:nicotinate phosphoribosyltransferase n=1 Tax=Bacillus phage G TaxID=2884420 RepID=G3MA18_9CAUD|nr:gp277 [Bacillus phage G]AEO93536.1 gp277 [Bacillus phage G]